MKRKQVAVTLIRRLADIVTAIGTLVLKGLGEARIGLLPDDLSPFWTSSQVPIFSAAKELSENRYQITLISDLAL